jgi:hypothetical protein
MREVASISLPVCGIAIVRRRDDNLDAVSRHQVSNGIPATVALDE